MVCTRGGIVALVAFVWLFSTVRFQMCPQIAWIRAGKVTLAAFVWLFSTVRYQMCPQIACQRRGIVTLVAFVWLFSTVRFQMCPQIACPRRGIIRLHLFGLSPLCVLKCLLKDLGSEQAKSHWLHLFDFSRSLFVFFRGTSTLTPLSLKSSSTRSWSIISN